VQPGQIKDSKDAGEAVGLIVSACGGLEIQEPLKQEAKEMLTGFQITQFF